MTKIHSKVLHRALQTIAPAVNPKAVLPLLTNVRFHAGSVTATDLELEITTKSGLPDAFAAVIPFEELRSIAGAVNEDLTLQVRGNSLTVAASSAKWKLTLPDGGADNWPTSPAKPETIHDVPEGMIDAIYSGSKMLMDESATAFRCNVTMHHRDELLRVGGAANPKFYEAAFEVGPVADALIPPSITRALSGLQPTQFGISDGIAWFGMGSTSVAIRLAEGVIPVDNYRRFATIPAPANVTCDRSALVSAIAQARVLKRNLTDSVVLTLTTTGIALQYASMDGLNDAIVNVAGSGTAEGSFTANAQYLTDVLGCLDCETLGILYQGADRHIYLIHPDQPNTIAIVLPIQTL